ncbi:S1 family peptidase [Pedobacter sp. R-06]|uniref:S1 family peptidase n=1 Tax=Pedobacter sp. R-06 TaxID=3404051 RepID=UPI003CF4D2BC
MSSRKKCGCSNHEFDAEAAFRVLSRKYTALAKVLLEMQEKSSGFQESAQGGAMLEKLNWIIGGKEVPEGVYPECCLVGYRQGSSFHWTCTGILIAPNAVLTAGHCFVPGAIYEVALKATRIDSLSKAERIGVKKAVLHPGYNVNTHFNDLTVLMLDHVAKTVPIELASRTELNAAVEVRLVGFGNTDPLGTIGFGIKREVSVPIKSIRTSPAQDLQQQEYLYGYESDIEFVAGGDGYDSCTGDSGGPAYINVGGKLKLAGTTSRSSLDSMSDCGDGGIYSRVDSHLNFITDTIKKYS